MRALLVEAFVGQATRLGGDFNVVSDNIGGAAAFDAPDVKEAMAKQGNVIQIGTPEQALATFKAEGARFAALVKKAGVTPQ